MFQLVLSLFQRCYQNTCDVDIECDDASSHKAFEVQEFAETGTTNIKVKCGDNMSFCRLHSGSLILPSAE